MCDCRERVNARVDNGILREVLMRASGITKRQVESIVRQACDRRSVRSVAVDNGRLRDALAYAGWPSNEIDFLLYRSMHEHEGLRLMLLTTYRITLLTTHADGDDETRTVHQEGWSVNDAIEKAKTRAWEDEPDAEDVQAAWVEGG